MKKQSQIVCGIYIAATGINHYDEVLIVIKTDAIEQSIKYVINRLSRNLILCKQEWMAGLAVVSTSLGEFAKKILHFRLNSGYIVYSNDVI